MQNKNKLICLLILISTYCLLVGRPTKPASYTKEYPTSNVFCKKTSSNLLGDLPKLNGFENIAKTFNSNFSKKNNKNVYKTLTINKNSISAFFVQLRFIQTNTLINFRKTDLLFPFQYFW